MTPELQDEAVKIVYVNQLPEFLIKNNGGLHFYRLTPATQDDLQVMFQAKKVALEAKETV
jgi:hypothetical protein